jgi:hypothetical protein
MSDPAKILDLIENCDDPEKLKGKGQHYRIVSGERRFRALRLSQQRGELDGDFRGSRRNPHPFTSGWSPFSQPRKLPGRDEVILSLPASD